MTNSVSQPEQASEVPLTVLGANLGLSAVTVFLFWPGNEDAWMLRSSPALAAVVLAAVMAPRSAAWRQFSRGLLYGMVGSALVMIASGILLGAALTGG